MKRASKRTGKKRRQLAVFRTGKEILEAKAGILKALRKKGVRPNDLKCIEALLETVVGTAVVANTLTMVGGKRQ